MIDPRISVPRVGEIDLRCRSCEAEFTSPLLLNIELDIAARFMKSLRCPNCGNGCESLSIRVQRPPDAETTG